MAVLEMFSQMGLWLWFEKCANEHKVMPYSKYDPTWHESALAKHDMFVYVDDESCKGLPEGARFGDILCIDKQGQLAVEGSDWKRGKPYASVEDVVIEGGEDEGAHVGLIMGLCWREDGVYENTQMGPRAFEDAETGEVRWEDAKVIRRKPRMKAVG